MMEFRWETETRKALQEAEALFTPKSIAWLESSLPSMDLMDPTSAIERLLGSILHEAPPADAPTDMEEDPSPRPRLEVGHPGPSLSSLRERARETKLRTFAHPSLGAHLPASVEPSQTAFTHPTPSIGTSVSDDLESPRKEMPRKVDLPTAKPILDTPRLGVTRLVTELPDLQNLFGELVSQPSTHEQADQKGEAPSLAELNDSMSRSSLAGSLPAKPSTERPPSPHAQASMSEHDPKVDPPRQIDATTRLHGPSFRRPEPMRDASPFLEGSEAPKPLLSNGGSSLNTVPLVPQSFQATTPLSPSLQEGPLPHAFSGLEDPTWEERLFDRFVDRWEDRLREQSIRHSGFTGGLT